MVNPRTRPATEDRVSCPRPSQNLGCARERRHRRPCLISGGRGRRGEFMRRPGAREQAQRQARGDEQQRRHALHGGASKSRCVCALRGVRRGRAPQARQETGSCRGARTAAPSAQVASAGPPVRQPADAAPHPQRSAAAHATPASHHARRAGARAWPPRARVTPARARARQRRRRRQGAAACPQCRMRAP